MKPRISIITPVLNAVTTISRCLESVASSKGLVVEHIIVDGGSTDGTLEILENHKDDFLRIIHAPARGIADAFNQGITAATGEWIGIINADDWYETGAIEKMAAHMHTVQILHGRCRLHNIETGESRESGRLDYNPQRHFQPLKKMPAQHPTCFVPQSVYEKVGLFSPSFSLAMDYDFLLRCHLKGISFLYIPEIIANFSSGGASSVAAQKARRQVMVSQILHLNTIPYPVWLYYHEQLQGFIRRFKKKYRAAFLSASTANNNRKNKGLL